ncbi:MAG: DUF2855 family protein [Rhodobacteraceae bacterium]|nr:DUF2855 family protein [Paracoccaceae bacterium]
MAFDGQALHINRSDLTQIDVGDLHLSDPGAGQAVLEISSFSLTANNITYAVAPDQIGYWNFFPSDREGWGHVPVWGFANVVASAHDELTEGQRVYGYFPMATHLTIEPGKVSPFTMLDMAAHRQPMAVIYNQYSFTKTDPFYSAETEGLISLFRPLFTTSFLLDDFHRRDAAFGASQVILSSASSKTAIGLAALLHANRIPGVEVIGLTSPGNRAFTESLGIYDRVENYDAVESIERNATAFVDMAGDADLLRRIHAHFNDQLMNSCRVGLTHWQSTSNWVEGLSGGPKPAFFFAPTYAQDRLAEWGREGFQQRMGAAWGAVIGKAEAWVDIREGFGAQAVQSAYLDLLHNRIDPKQGHILSMHAG